MFQTAQLLLAEPDLYDETVIASRKLADAGNKAAKNNNYHGAIRMYSEAINTYPFDHRCVHLYMYAKGGGSFTIDIKHHVHREIMTAVLGLNTNQIRCKNIRWESSS